MKSRVIAVAYLLLGMFVAWFLDEYVRVGLSVPFAGVVIGAVILSQLPPLAPVVRRENRPLFEEDEVSHRGDAEAIARERQRQDNGEDQP